MAFINIKWVSIGHGPLTALPIFLFVLGLLANNFPSFSNLCSDELDKIGVFNIVDWLTRTRIATVQVRGPLITKVTIFPKACLCPWPHEFATYSSP